MRDLYVNYKDTEEVYIYKQSKCFATWDEGLPKSYENYLNPWQEYYRWDYDPDRVYVIETDYGDYPREYQNKKSTPMNMDIVRQQYYKCGRWIHTRNQLLWENNFVCAGCGGIAKQAHHQGWSSKWQNYEYLGNAEKEYKCLVPICQDCHQVVTRVQNKKRWHIKHVESRIKIQSQSPFIQSGFDL
jgi:hypothetical protein